MMNCWFCGPDQQLIWGGDFDFQDYGLEGDGIIANLSCPKCGSYVEARTALNEEEVEEQRCECGENAECQCDDCECN